MDIKSLCEMFTLSYITLQHDQETRWVASLRNLLESVLSQLATLRFVYTTFVATSTCSQDDKSMLKSFVKCLTSHKFLYLMHFFLDVLQIETEYSKGQEGGGGSCVTLVSNYSRLIQKIPAMQNPANCPTLQLYLRSILPAKGGVREIEAYRTCLASASIGIDKPKWNIVHVELADFEAKFSSEQQSLVDELRSRLCSLAPSRGRQAMADLFDCRRYNFGIIRGDPDYFVVSAVHAFVRFRVLYDPWMEECVPTQARSLRDLLLSNTTGGQSWEYLSQTLTVGAFWALVREEAGCISTSEKAPNNIPTEVKQRQRRHTRTFKSTETPGRNNPSPTPEIKDSEIGLSSESDSDDPQEHSNSEDEAKAHPDDTRVFLSENVRAVRQDSGGQEQTQVGTDTVYVGDDFGHEASQLLDEMGAYVGPPRHPPPPPPPPPPPSHPSESPPSPSAAYVVLSPIPSHPSQHSLPTPSPRYKSPSAPTASNRLNISVILLLRKMCIIDDGSAAQVEQANSLYSSALRDPRRRGANDATVENILRVTIEQTRNVSPWPRTVEKNLLMMCYVDNLIPV